MRIAVVDYRAGNVQSVLFALQRLGYDGELTADRAELVAADRVIFPGVGEAAYAMDRLRATELVDAIPQLRQPVLGICLGMQLLCRHTEEGNTDGLGLIDAQVKRLPAQDAAGQRCKVPHVGWNALQGLTGPLFEGISEGSYAYFVHSYYAEITGETCAVTHYGLPFAATVQRANFFATQFHPEKSGAVGDRLLRNFLNLKLN